MEAKGSIDMCKTRLGAGSCTKMIFVSVIIPVYNSEKTLQRCVESVLNQTIQDFEIILIDDGSCDESVVICDMYAQQNRNVSVIHQKNQGVSVARNVGIEIARGEYVLFLDSDDTIKGDLIEQYMIAVKDGDVDVVIGSLELLDTNGKVIGRKAPDRFGVFGNEIWDAICLDSEIFGYAGGKMIARRIVTQSKIHFDTKSKSQEDLAFNIAVYSMSEKWVLLSYAGYCYYYIENQRKPYYWLYIENQLKIILQARKKTVVSEKAECTIRKRIELLIYMYLYSAFENQKEYSKAITKLSKLNNLTGYIQEQFDFSEIGVINFLFAKGNYHCVQCYFMCREIIKQLIKRVKRK